MDTPAPAPAPTTPASLSEDDLTYADPDPDPWPPAEPPDEDGAKMSFLDHLDELRKRIIHSVVALVLGCVVAFVFIDRIFGFVMGPLVQLMPEGQRLQAIEPTEPFFIYMKLAVLGGLLIASPVIMWELWLFIAPGLYSHEKRFAIPFVAMTTFFFVAGAAFSHYVVFPLAWQFFLGFNSAYLVVAPSIGPTFKLYVQMLLALGLVFELPTVVFFLARMGVVTAGYLVRHTKYAVLIIFIVAAVVTPSADIVTQTLVAGPMCVLYILSIAIAWIFGRKKTAAP